MRYYKLADGSTPNLYEVRQQLSPIGIPEGADLTEFGYVTLFETTIPQAQANKKVVESYEAVQGGYQTVYTQVALTAQEIAAAKKLRVPQSITMRQARLALLYSSLLDTVETKISEMTGAAGKAARIEWDYSSEVWRNKALVQTLGPSLGLSEDQLDDLFIFASTIL